MKHNFLLFMATLLISSTMVGASINNPDFSFPKDVIINADSTLNVALKTGDGNAIISSIIQSSIAKASISKDNFQSIVTKIDSIASIEKNDVTKAILYSFEAQLYQINFQHNWFKISSVTELETNEYPTDITEWNASNYSKKIKWLIEKSISNDKLLKATPIQEYNGVINYNTQGAVYEPTIYDFLSHRAVDIISNRDLELDSLSNVIINNLLEFNKNNPAQYIYTSLSNSNNNAMSVDYLFTLYDKYKDSEYCGLILNEIPIENTDHNSKLYGLLNQYLLKFPTSSLIPQIKNIIEKIEIKEINIFTSQVINTNDSLIVDHIATNANNYTISIYRIPNNIEELSSKKTPLDKLKLIETKEFNNTNKIPFRSDTIKTKFGKLGYGRYIVVPNCTLNDGRNLENLYYQKHNDIITVTDIKLISICNNSLPEILAVSTIDGSPIKDVIISNNKQLTLPIKNKTNKDGIFKVTSLLERQPHFFGTKGDDIFSPKIYTYKNSVQNGSYGEVFTDLGVYRPGDSIKVVAVCYGQNGVKHNASALKSVTIKLLNTNSELIDSLHSITDDFGRISTTFTIPKEGLNGDYSIVLEENTSSKQSLYLAQKHVSVSEYKAPSYKVEFIDFRPNYNINDSIKINGIVKSFSGVALSEIKVNLSFYRMQWLPYRFMRNNEEYIKTLELTTNSKGEFSITEPMSIISSDDDNVFNYNRVRVEAIATSSAGETQTTSNMFLINNYSKLSIASDQSFNIDSSIKLPITIAEEKPYICKYEVLNNNNIVVNSGTFSTTNYTVDLSALPSGKYELSARLLNDSISTDKCSIILYHTTDSKSPIQSPLWIPTTDIQCDKDNVAIVTIGNSTPKSNIYYIAYDNRSIINRSWIHYDEGIHQFKFKMPKNYRGDIKIQFITTQDNITTRQEVNIKSHKEVEKISILYTSFRDKVIPNALEKWSFKVVNNDSIPRLAAFIAEMFDNAINSIRSNDWELNISLADNGYSYFNYNHTSSFFQLWEEQKRPIAITKIEYPTLNLYRHSHYILSGYRVMARGFSGKSNASYKSAQNELYAAESKSLDEVVIGQASATPNSTSDAKTPSITYRLNNTRTAFWEPMLTTDDNGNVAFEFMVPENNTTWLFQALAYTSDMLKTRVSTEVLANKPIMVKPNIPRFLRHGDKATISGQVLNATDSVENCNIEIQLYNISTDEVLLTKQFKTLIPAHGDKGFDIEWCIPDTISFLGYRIKASNHNYGDGEQALIAILPATSPVIESIPFFINDKENNYSFNLPKYPSNSVITLEYCNNPVWYCVTAIPSLQSIDAITANGIASTLFTNLMAKGIITKYPNIKVALDDWKKDTGNTNLISMLSKNDELKNVSLKNTPWLPQAQQENILMSQLASFTDNKMIANTITKSIASLKELQQSDGGWGWFSGCKSSEYITYDIMQDLGYLKNLGFIEKDTTLNLLIANGVKYIDNRLIEVMKSKTTYSSSSLLPYLYVRTMFSEIPLSATLTQFCNSALGYTQSNWKKMSMADKTFSAITLAKNGKMNTAKQIIESLRQFSITRPTTGMYWDNLQSNNYFIYNNVALTSLMLQAFNAIDPQCADIDQIRKWLLLQKQTTNWGTSTMAGDAIYSILSTGSNWINDNSSNNAVITLNSTPLAIDSVASYTGYIKQNISINPNITNTISISRNGVNPAWGSLFCQYVAPIQSISNKSIEGLSIEKDLYKNINGKLQKASTFNVGDKVTVRFTIKSSRTLDYVNITDERSACIEPADQLSGIEYKNNNAYYKELRNTSTNLYFATLSKGTHIIDYDVFITATGTYSLGIATIQCQYAPQMVANSAGSQITVTK